MKTLLLVFFAFALQAPIVPIAPGPRASVEGVVLSVEGRPVAGAEVRASWSPPPQAYTPDQVPRAISDKDGKFFLRELGAGGYRLRVTAGGYAWQEYGAPIPGQLGAEQGMVLTLTPGQLLQGITIRLAGEGVVSGRITSTNGSPFLGMDVHAFPPHKLQAAGVTRDTVKPGTSLTVTGFFAPKANPLFSLTGFAREIELPDGRKLKFGSTVWSR